MNRPIKSRAWNLRDRTMHEVAWIRYENGQDVSSVGVYWNDGRHNGATRLDAEDVVLMQNTGLIDKNDAEIYEGDRLEYQPDHCDPDEYIERYSVEWRGNGFVGVWDGDKDAKNSDNDGLIDAHLDIAVIGNIYETPELLEPQS